MSSLKEAKTKLEDTHEYKQLVKRKEAASLWIKRNEDNLKKAVEENIHNYLAFLNQ